MKIDRHPCDPQLFANSFERNREKLQGYLVRRPVTPRLLEGLHSLTINVQGYGSVLAPDDPILALAGRTNAQATAALLAAQSGLKGPFPWGDSEAEVDVPKRGANVLRAVESQYFALIYGDTRSQDLIARTPSHALAAARTDAFWQTWKNALDCFHDAPHLALDGVRQAQQATESATVGQAEAIRLARLAMAVFEAVLLDDAEQASGRLVELLEAHRVFWTSDGNANLPAGLVSLAGSAALAVAAARGLAVDVQSDYLIRAS